MHYIALVLLSILLLNVRQVTGVSLAALAAALIAFALYTAPASWDYAGYRSYYQCSIAGDCLNTNLEWSFSFLASLLSALFGEQGFSATLVFYVGISIALKLNVLRKHSAWFGASLFAMVCYGYFIHEMTQIRASLAIALCWLAYSKFLEHKAVPSLLLIGAAIMIHTSALLGLMPLALAKLRPKTLIWGVLGAATLGQVLPLNDLLAALESDAWGRIGVYVSAQGSPAFSSPQFPAFVVILLLTNIAAIWRLGERLSEFERLSVNSALFGIAIYLAFYRLPVLSSRALEFYASLYPITVARLFRSARLPLARTSLVLMHLALFFNLVVRHPNRVDFTFDFQEIDARLMTAEQYEQYLH